MFVAIGTGYTPIEPDWRHGMYQGPLVVQGKVYKTAEITPPRSAERRRSRGCFRYADRVGYGLYEHAFIGPLEK